MKPQEIRTAFERVDGRLNNIDLRLERIEQFLPTVATKDELEKLSTKMHQELRSTKEEMRTLATKEELKAFATKEDLKAFATKEDLKAFATKEDLKAFATKDEMREEGERSRRYMLMLVERLEAKIALYAEAMTALDQRDARQHTDTVKAHQALEGRVSRLEASRPKPRA